MVVQTLNYIHFLYVSHRSFVQSYWNQTIRKLNPNKLDYHHVPIPNFSTNFDHK